MQIRVGRERKRGRAGEPNSDTLFAEVIVTRKIVFNVRSLRDAIDRGPKGDPKRARRTISRSHIEQKIHLRTSSRSLLKTGEGFSKAIPFYMRVSQESAIFSSAKNSAEGCHQAFKRVSTQPLIKSILQKFQNVSDFGVDSCIPLLLHQNQNFPLKIGV